jgi:hypothetical protein
MFQGNMLFCLSPRPGTGFYQGKRRNASYGTVFLSVPYDYSILLQIGIRTWASYGRGSRLASKGIVVTSLPVWELTLSISPSPHQPTGSIKQERHITRVFPAYCLLLISFLLLLRTFICSLLPCKFFGKYNLPQLILHRQTTNRYLIAAHRQHILCFLIPSIRHGSFHRAVS